MREIHGEAEFRSSVIESERPVFVTFSAVWCAPCTWLAPYLEEVVRGEAGRIDAVKVDVDRDPELTTRFRVTSVPTVLHMEGGKEVGRSVGIEPDRLREMAARSRPSAPSSGG